MGNKQYFPKSGSGGMDAVWVKLHGFHNLLCGPKFLPNF